MLQSYIASSEKLPSLGTTETLVIRLMSGLALVFVFICLTFSVYNIYAYLYKDRQAKTLITAFYVALVLMLLMEVPMWSCTLLIPETIAFPFYDDKQRSTAA